MPCSCCCKFARDSNEIRHDQSDSHRHLSLDVIDVVDLIAFMGRFDQDLTSRLETIPKWPASNLGRVAQGAACNTLPL